MYTEFKSYELKCFLNIVLIYLASLVKFYI